MILVAMICSKMRLKKQLSMVYNLRLFSARYEFSFKKQLSMVYNLRLFSARYEFSLKKQVL